MRYNNVPGHYSMADLDDVPELKLVLLGAAHVGKTSLLARASTGCFRQPPENTMGAVATSFTLPKLRARLKVWDTAGAERYRSLAPMYCRGASAALIVFDVTERSSFQALPEWANIIRNSAPQCCFGILGNKVDLADRTVDFQEGEATANELRAEFYLETSAVNGQNVSAAFQRISEASQPSESVQEPIPRDDPKWSSSCC
jgi:small GTP-binding protein